MANDQEIHFIGRIAQKALIADDGNILLVRTVGEERFAFPGGRLNEGEEPVEGLVREVREEIGIDILVERPFATGSWISPKGDPHFLVVYLARLPEGAVLTPAPGEIEEVRQIAEEELDSIDIYPEYRKIIETYFHEHGGVEPLSVL